MWKWILVGALVLFFVPGFVLLLLPGDFYSSLSFDFVAPKQESALAKSYLEAARHRDFAPIQKALDRKYANPQLPSVLAQVAAQFPAGEPQAIRLITSNWLSMNGRKTTTLTYVYDYPHDKVAATVVIREENGQTVLEGLHVTRLDAQTREAGSFGFRGKTPFHFAYLAAMLAAYVFTLVSVFYCMKTPIPRLKWAWVIFVLLGFVTFRLNWATGNLTIQPISLLICSVGFSKMGLGPVILQLAIPVGAIVFWSRRYKWLTAAALKEADLRNAPASQAP